MTKAVIFDLYETLITLTKTPPYFGANIAHDAGLPQEEFLRIWRGLEDDRTYGFITLENALRKCGVKDEKTLRDIVRKRRESRAECYTVLHEGILPMLSGLREKRLKLGLLSNCFDEEAEAFRESRLLPYFDEVTLSCEVHRKKPEHGIFEHCIENLGVPPEECLYIGDGGSHELEAAREMKMHPYQAVWYLKENSVQPVSRLSGYEHLESPMDVLKLI